jgi:hypothetical protein
LFLFSSCHFRYDLQEPKLAKQLSWIHDAPGKGRELLLNWKSTTEDQNGIETGKAGCLGLELESIRNEMVRIGILNQLTSDAHQSI